MPQIEMMMSDLPHTLYRRRNEKNNGPSQDDVDEATRLFNEAQKRKRSREEDTDKERSVTIDELFNGEAD